MTDRRVVITGIGVVSPIGNDLETFWKNLVAGTSGIRLIQAFDTSDYGCKIGGEVLDFDPAPFFKNPKDARRADRYAQLAMAGAKMAIQDGGLDLDSLDLTRFGCMVGCGIGGLMTLETQHSTSSKKALPRLPLHHPDDDLEHRQRDDLDGLRLQGRTCPSSPPAPPPTTTSAKPGA